MSLYCALVANEPLQEIDHSGIEEVTVGELKKLYPIAEATVEQPWHSMDDDVRMLHVPDQSAFGRLSIFKWNNPPYDLEDYSDKKYRYGVEGNWDSEFLQDLYHYLKTTLTQDRKAELIRFWTGDMEADRSLVERKLSIKDLELSHLESVQDERYLRLVFE